MKYNLRKDKLITTLSFVIITELTSSVLSWKVDLCVMFTGLMLVLCCECCVVNIISPVGFGRSPELCDHCIRECIDAMCLSKYSHAAINQI